MRASHKAHAHNASTPYLEDSHHPQPCSSGSTFQRPCGKCRSSRPSCPTSKSRPREPSSPSRSVDRHGAFRVTIGICEYHGRRRTQRCASATDHGDAGSSQTARKVGNGLAAHFVHSIAVPATPITLQQQLRGWGGRRRCLRRGWYYSCRGTRGSGVCCASRRGR